MNYLAIDTSSKHLTVVACKNGQKYNSFIENCALNHSVLLMAEIEKVLSEINLKISECDFFGVCVGAGSFTGIRIGISTIKAFCLATNKKAVALTSFDVIAYNVFETENALCVIDAGHNNFYACAYDKDKNVILQPCFINLDKLKELSQSYAVYSFDELPINYKKTNKLDGFIRAMEAKKDFLTLNISALYIRKSNAEENRKA